MGSGLSSNKKLNQSSSEVPAANAKGESAEGKKVPDVTFRTRVRDDSQTPNPFKWQDRTSDDIFKGKKIVVLALPGAFTPTCSSAHLPGYDAKYNDFKALGVDEVVCLSVNDAFVMFQWGKNLGLKHVFLLPDGNADFTKAMGMLVKKSNLGFGLRSWRYSMFVDDGVVKKQFIEAGFADDFESDPFEVSDAETMLKFLTEAKAQQAKDEAANEEAAKEAAAKEAAEQEASKGKGKEEAKAEASSSSSSSAPAPATTEEKKEEAKKEEPKKEEPKEEQKEDVKEESKKEEPAPAAEEEKKEEAQ